MAMTAVLEVLVRCWLSAQALGVVLLETETALLGRREPGGLVGAADSYDQPVSGDVVLLLY